MKTEYPYTAELDEDGFLFVQFIDLEDTFTQGETLEEAAYNASEVLSLMLAYRMEKNQDIPEPSTCPTNGYLASPNSRVQAALLLRKARGKKSLTELANAMNATWTITQRLEDPNQ